jgi:uncharacterized protein
VDRVVEATKPLPVPDAQSEEFWRAAAKHNLAIQQCSSCRRFAHPPVVVCPGCLSPDASFVFEIVTGSGWIRSWTVIRQAFLPAFHLEVPWVIADVEFDSLDGVRMIGRLVDGPGSKLSIGARVFTTFEDISPEVALPCFKLVED